MAGDHRIQPTWPWREQPILEELLRRFDAGETHVLFTAIGAATGLDEVQVDVGISALEGTRPPYLDEVDHLEGGRHLEGIVFGVRERARRELGSWPSAESVLDRLFEALTTAAESAAEPERKGRLRAAADVLAGMAREVAVGVISHQIGG